ncbi:MAG: DUF1016 N-terminal domain-containing protein [Methanothrix sp.]|nr:DUF1016 N-terminal domain-containing protein [Methanothrix sp.]
MQGLSPRNLKYMRAFPRTWQDRQIVQEVLAQITWYYNLAHLSRSPKRRSHTIIRKIDFDRLKQEYERSLTKNRSWVSATKECANHCPRPRCPSSSAPCLS